MGGITIRDNTYHLLQTHTHAHLQVNHAPNEKMFVHAFLRYTINTQCSPKFQPGHIRVNACTENILKRESEYECLISSLQSYFLYCSKGSLDSSQAANPSVFLSVQNSTLRRLPITAVPRMSTPCTNAASVIPKHLSISSSPLFFC